MKKLAILAALMLSFSSVFAADQFIEGVITKVDASKKEIVVNYEGKAQDLYFFENTELMKRENAVNFDALKVGQKVRVKTKLIDKELKPVRVEIL